MTLDDVRHLAERLQAAGASTVAVPIAELLAAIKAERELHARQLNKLAEAAGGGSR